MRKRILPYVLFSIIIIIFSAGAAAAGTPLIKLVLNGSPVATDVAPVLQSGRTLVPVRVIMENLGAQVDWSDQTETITVRGAGKTILLKIGSREATVNGEEIALDTAAKIISKRTFIPLRFVSEAMGAEVGWEEASFTVHIRTKPAELIRAEWQKDETGTRLILTTDAPVAFDPLYQAGSNLLSVRLPRTVLAVPERTTPVNDPAVRTIRVAQEADSARVDIELAAGQPYRTVLSTDRKTMTINFPARITGIGMETADGKDTLQLAATGPLQFAVTETTDPHQIDLRLTGAVIDMPDGEIRIDNGYISTVRYSQVSPDTVKVVVALREKVTYRAGRGDGGINLTFNPLLVEMALERDGFDGTLRLTSLMPLEYTTVSDPETGSLVLEIPDAELKAGGIMTFSGEQEPGYTIPFPRLAAGCSLEESVLRSIQLVRMDGGAGKVVLVLNPARGYEFRERESEDCREIIIDVIARPLVGKTIVVDPGHGGRDVGAVGATGKYEKDVNHSVGQILREMLERLGATVLVTNTADNYMDGYARADIANAAAADAFLSIHANAFTNPASHGTETYYWTTNPYSKHLADNIHQYLQSATGLADRGVKSEQFIVIRETAMPSALVEIAFITNPAEEKLLFDPFFQQQVAAALRDGLLEFFGEAL